MDEQIEDLTLIEAANFERETKLSVTSIVTSLHYLKGLAAERGMKMEQITAQLIVNEFSGADAKLKAFRNSFERSSKQKK